jgi:hypothetical protein
MGERKGHGSEGGYFGHMTMADGSHVPLTADDAKALWEATEQARKKTEADYPDEQTTLREMCRAHHRMKDFGWREGIYRPKDGSEFEIIEAGSTGIFRCRYDDHWPDGMWLTFAEGEVYPSSRPPLMFRLLPEAQAEYDRKMAEAAKRFRDEDDR